MAKGKIVTNCPRCKTQNQVQEDNVYMRGDMSTHVKCRKCRLQFSAILKEEDIEALYEDEHSVYPHVKGEEDYLLASQCYPD